MLDLNNLAPKPVSEMDRIVKLPRVCDVPEHIVQEFSRRILLPDSTWKTLNQAQVAGIVSYLRFGGLLGAIGVGFGKTMISFKIADLAYAKGIRKILLLIPANTVSKTVYELPDLKKEISLNFPIHVLGGKAAKKRKQLSQETSGVFIMSYSQLSLKDTDEILRNISPETIIADEVHNLANIDKSAAAKRINRYMNEFPETEMCGMSGTVTNKGLHEFAHLTMWCLKDKSPIPLIWAEVDLWNQCLGTTFSDHVMEKTMQPIIDWARRNYLNDTFDNTEVASLRKAFKYRFETAPGSVTSGDAGVKASLIIDNVPAENLEDVEGGLKIIQYMADVQEINQAPDGTCIEFDLHKFRHLWCLTSGFYLELYWPETSTVSRRRECSDSEAKTLLDRSQQHLKSKQIYSKELRDWLGDNDISGLDSPMLLGNEMRWHGAQNVGEDLYSKWRDMKELDFDERVDRDSRDHRICDYKIRAAIKQAKKIKKSCIFWCHNIALSYWLFESMKAADLDVVHAPAGTVGDFTIMNKENKDKFIVASTYAHGTGKNLQHMKHAYYVQLPRSATQCEQSLGRLHRQGYLYDQCVQYTNLTTEFDHQCFAACLADSLYQHQMLTQQKLVYADYTTMPKRYSDAALKERGLIGKVSDEWEIN